MKAMILAAGRGTRLGPLTERVPKPLLRIAGKPIIEATVERLVTYGITDVIINVSHLAEAIMNHLGDGGRWGANITYSRELEPLGTAGGVRNASWFFDGAFLLWYGDNLCACDIDRLCQVHREKGGLATLCLHERDEVSQSGVVETDADGRILRFVEKPAEGVAFSNWVNAGIYVLETEILRHIPADGAPDFGKDVFPAILAAGERMNGHRLTKEEDLIWIDRQQDIDRLEPNVRPYL